MTESMRRPGVLSGFSILMAFLVTQLACMPLFEGEMGGLLPPAEVTNGGQFSVVTSNTWRLNEEHRIEPLLGALAKMGEDLGRKGSTVLEKLPDVLLFQELEAQNAIDKLKNQLSAEHQLEVALCDDWETGRSAVGIAFRRSRFTLVEKRKIDLKKLANDHRRCAMVVKVRPKNSTQLLTFVSVHLSIWLDNSEAQTKILKEELSKDITADQGVLLAGDFNFNQDSGGYKVVTSFLKDPYPSPRGRTHWFRGRIDFAFVSPTIRLVRPLTRKLAFTRFRPKRAYIFVPAHCKDRQRWRADCPISDHLPEGGVFQFQVNTNTNQAIQNRGLILPLSLRRQGELNRLPMQPQIKSMDVLLPQAKNVLR